MKKIVSQLLLTATTVACSNQTNSNLQSEQFAQEASDLTETNLANVFQASLEEPGYLGDQLRELEAAVGRISGDFEEAGYTQSTEPTVLGVITHGSIGISKTFVSANTNLVATLTAVVVPVALPTRPGNPDDPNVIHQQREELRLVGSQLEVGHRPPLQRHPRIGASN